MNLNAGEDYSFDSFLFSILLFQLCVCVRRCRNVVVFFLFWERIRFLAGFFFFFFNYRVFSLNELDLSEFLSL